jgi:spermidine synthase
MIREDYIEENPDLHVTYTWHNTRRVFHQTTRRGTLLEMVDRPLFGLSCYMNGIIQSCESDERAYHKALVKPVLKGLGSDLRVAIFGGGEGSTAREVLRKRGVTHVDMFEWDEDVISAFRTKFKQWGDLAWDDPRLHLHYDDAYERIKTVPEQLYDAVIVDLFDIDADTLQQSIEFLERAMLWTEKRIGLYVTTHSPYLNSSHAHIRRLRTVLRNGGYKTHLSSIYIPSFNGYSVFLLGLASDSE